MTCQIAYHMFFQKNIKDKYKDSNVVHFDNDGYFSFSFGIPMPK